MKDSTSCIGCRYRDKNIDQNPCNECLKAWTRINYLVSDTARGPVDGEAFLKWLNNVQQLIDIGKRKGWLAYDSENPEYYLNKIEYNQGEDLIYCRFKEELN